MNLKLKGEHKFRWVWTGVNLGKFGGESESYQDTLNKFLKKLVKILLEILKSV